MATVSATPNRMIGQKIKRKEDPRFITGKGKYTDDIQLPHMVYVALARSDRGHARIKRLDVSQAKGAPGVVGVYTGADLDGKVGGVPCGAVTPEGKHWLAGVDMKVPPFPVLAIGQVNFVGQAYAAVVATDPYLAHDAMELIDADFEDLPAVVDPEKAAEAGSPLVHEALGSNVCFHIPGGPTPEAQEQVEQLFAKAEMTATFRFDNQRLIPMAMEPRATVADFDVGREQLTVWTSTQVPHWTRTLLSLLLPHPEAQIRVVAPDVGGGFGSKLNLYGEEILTAYLSKTLERPVKYSGKRREDFAATIHGRGQVQHVDLAFNKDGTWLAMKLRMYNDLGAYLQLLTPGIGAFTAAMATGCYQPQAFWYEHYGVLTNKMATDAYRGAGRPEATMIAEKVMDVIARETGLDPADVRRKNFLRTFPATPPTGMVYDSGDYEVALNKALETIGYNELREAQRKVRAEGRLMGIGMCSYVELCGVGPSWLAGPGTGFWDVSTVRMEPSGMVTVLTGISPHGQGEETTFAQITADELGVPMESVRVLHSDTLAVPYGNGTYGSRGQAIGGAALMMSLGKVKEKAKKIAAHMLDAQPEAIAYENGELFVQAEPARKKTIAEVVFEAYNFSFKGPGSIPTDIEPGLEETSRFEPPNLTFPFGTHICALEIERDTGEVTIQRFVAVDDCGTVINPLIVDGQVHGGIVQGMAQSLFEGVVYDENGQLLTGELTDYAVPKASMVGRFENLHTVTPSPVNPLGAKGVGEAGTIGSTAAVFSAVMDALQPLGVTHVDMPLRPDKLWHTIQQHSH